MVRELGFDLDGWKSISTTLGVSVRTAQRWRFEGMPVAYVGRRVLGRSDAVRAWFAERVVSCRLVSLADMGGDAAGSTS